MSLKPYGTGLFCVTHSAEPSLLPLVQFVHFLGLLDLVSFLVCSNNSSVVRILNSLN